MLRTTQAVFLNTRCDLSNSQSCEHKEADNSCTVFLQNYCQSSPHPFCKNQENFGPEDHCKEKINSHCRQNSNQKICHHYNDRCRVNQENCLIELADQFEEFKKNTNITDQNFIPLKIHRPFRTCQANPFEFFRFERKMSVLELDSNSFRYLGGIPFSFSASSSHSATSAMRWDGQISTSFSIGPSFGVGTDRRRSQGSSGRSRIPSAGKIFLGGTSLDAKLTADAKMGMGSSASNSGGRDVSIRVVEGAYLSVHQIPY